MQVFFWEEVAKLRKGQSVQDGWHNLWRLESEEAPALTPYLVITGNPGSGKSTLMAHLALCMAGDMLHDDEESQADLNKLGFWPHPAYTPVYIELRTLVRSAFPSLDDEITVGRLLTTWTKSSLLRTA